MARHTPARIGKPGRIVRLSGRPGAASPSRLLAVNRVGDRSSRRCSSQGAARRTRKRPGIGCSQHDRRHPHPWPCHRPSSLLGRCAYGRTPRRYPTRCQPNRRSRSRSKAISAPRWSSSRLSGAGVNERAPSVRPLSRGRHWFCLCRSSWSKSCAFQSIYSLRPYRRWRTGRVLGVALRIGRTVEYRSAERMEIEPKLRRHRRVDLTFVVVDQLRSILVRRWPLS